MVDKSADEVCVSTCMDATVSDCDCRCGGKNHASHSTAKLDTFGGSGGDPMDALRQKFMGKKVTSKVGFHMIPAGTVGTVVEVYDTSAGKRKHIGVTVEWKTSSGHTVRDGFGVDEKFDETAWLDVVA